MSDYRRIYATHATYFFTVVTADRRPLLASADNIARLREAFRQVRRKRPFELEAIVVLPDHLHCLWRMTADNDFSVRWQMVKSRFSRAISAPRRPHGSKRVWQPRFWEHLIRDEADLHRHFDYIHYNPVKHGYVALAREWPYSSFPRFVERGWYEPEWGAAMPDRIRDMDPE